MKIEFERQMSEIIARGLKKVVASGANELMCSGSRSTWKMAISEKANKRFERRFLESINRKISASVMVVVVVFVKKCFSVFISTMELLQST